MGVKEGCAFRCTRFEPVNLVRHAEGEASQCCYYCPHKQDCKANKCFNAKGTLPEDVILECPNLREFPD